ncbi:hypothetical protein EPYR_03438 [Erwinia pyrifoliae DSM 12163]|nr:hypothetical protein EPYR_03429 [Erwinia pyrifoliae DSM 12163]CAY75818.1 hypothetical protein EPYR_03438 [Erwinia pyrifoliae DSM 12163]
MLILERMLYLFLEVLMSEVVVFGILNKGKSYAINDR